MDEQQHVQRLALTALLALDASACGGGSRPPGAPTATAATTGTQANGGTGRCPAAAHLTGRVNDHGAAAASGPLLQVQAGDTFFAPTCETSVPAGTVTLVVRNTGRALHNVSVPGQGIDTDLAAGQTITVHVKVSGGAVAYFCKYHRTAGMVGSLLPSQG